MFFSKDGKVCNAWKVFSFNVLRFKCDMEFLQVLISLSIPTF